MSENSPAPTSPPGSRTATVTKVAALFTFLAVAMGAVVCATKSGAACPTWPGCRHTNLTPQWELSPVIEMTHRVVAVSAGPLLLASAVLMLKFRALAGWTRALPWLSLVGALASGFFGRMVIVSKLSTVLGAIDLFCALAAMTMMAWLAVMVTRSMRPEGPGEAPTADIVQVRKLAAAGVVTVIALHVTGIFTSGKGSYTGCLGWPLWQTVGIDLHPWLQWVRLGLACVGAIVVVATATLAYRSERLRLWGIAIGALFAAEMVLGVVIRAQGLNNGVASGYSVAAAALLWSLGLLTAVTGTVPLPADATSPQSDAARAGELAKPGRR
jgi:cytochrome c oxidase assembly protein subunit 15